MREFGICPECGDTTAQRYRPFCSKRCADVDLSRWLRGAYAIAGATADEDDDGDNANAAEMVRREGAVQRGDGGGSDENGFH